MELDESGSLTSDYTLKLQPSKQYGTSTKTEIQSKEQDRNPRNKPMHLQSINLQQRRQEYTMKKRQSLQQEVSGKLDSCM